MHPKERIARIISRLSCSIGYLAKIEFQTAGAEGQCPWLILGMLSIEIHSAKEAYQKVETMKRNAERLAFVVFQ
jgi:hypothetical protein